MTIQDQFTVEITRVTVEDDTQDVVATHLSAGIIHWEREIYEEDEDEDDGFLVSDEDDSAADDEEESDADDSVDCETDNPTGLLTVQTTLNKDVLEDIRALQEGNTEDRLLIKFVYGNTEGGMFTRQFEVSSDVSVVLSEHSQYAVETSAELRIALTFDLFDSDFIF